MNLNFIGVYSRDNLPDKAKDGAYVINLDEYSEIGTHWVALYVNNKTVTYFDSFGIEHIPKEVKKFIGHRNIISNIYRIQNYDLIMCSYFCIGFINYMFKGESLTNLFSPSNFKKNDDMILNVECNSINDQVSHEDFITIVNEEKNYRELKESIRMMKGKEDKKIDID